MAAAAVLAVCIVCTVPQSGGGSHSVQVKAAAVGDAVGQAGTGVTHAGAGQVILLPERLTGGPPRASES